MICPPPNCTRSGRAGYRYVTHAGEVLEADGTLRAGPLTRRWDCSRADRSWNPIAIQQIADVDHRIELTHPAVQRRQRRRQRRWKSSRTRCATRLSGQHAKVELTSQIAQNNDKQNSLRASSRCSIANWPACSDQVGKLKPKKTALIRAEAMSWNRAGQSASSGQD
jgi:hypothetical protein